MTTADETPRVVDVPEELAAALKADPAADAAYSRMSFSHRREWAEYVAGGKKPETRVRRAAKALEDLRSR